MNKYSRDRWDSLILLRIILVIAGSEALVVLGLVIADMAVPIGSG